MEENNLITDVNLESNIDKSFLLNKVNELEEKIKFYKEQEITLKELLEKERDNNKSLSDELDKEKSEKYELKENFLKQKGECNYYLRKLNEKLKTLTFEDSFEVIDRLIDFKNENELLKEKIRQLEIEKSKEKNNSLDLSFVRSNHDSMVQRLQEENADIKADRNSLQKTLEMSILKNTQLQEIELKYGKKIEQYNSLKTDYDTLLFKFNQVSAEAEKYQLLTRQLREESLETTTETKSRLIDLERIVNLLVHVSKRFEASYAGLPQYSPVYNLFNSLSDLFKLLSSTDIKSSEIISQLLECVNEARRIVSSDNITSVQERRSESMSENDLLKSHIQDLEDETEELKEKIRELEENDTSSRLATALFEINRLRKENESLTQQIQSPK